MPPEFNLTEKRETRTIPPEMPNYPDFDLKEIREG
jgi:hypothetical protein